MQVRGIGGFPYILVASFDYFHGQSVLVTERSLGEARHDDQTQGRPILATQALEARAVGGGYWGNADTAKCRFNAALSPK
jgi:hypothetical protein